MKNKLLIIFSLIFLSGAAQSQCNWTTVVNESFEYTTVIPGVIPNSIYQDVPQTYAGTVHSGTYGMYLNIQNGYTGMLYSQE